MDTRVEKNLTGLLIDRCGDVTMGISWEYERRYLLCIRNGDTGRLKTMLAEFSSERADFPEHVRFSGKQKQNHLFRFISAVTLMARASIEGGIPENLAYSMEESYIFCADKYQEDFFFDAAVSFSETVAKYKAGSGGDTPRIRKIKSYVMENLNSPVTLEKAAELVCLSPSRCAHIFKEETGMTFHQYLENERIQAAKANLFYTDMEISGISEYLMFSSPSHFCAVFRRHTGMSPGKWRIQNRREDPLRSGTPAM